MKGERDLEAWSVAIVIPARNAVRILPFALDSAIAQDYDGMIEVIVADGSDDSAVVELVDARYPTVRVVANPERILPTGVNRAVTQSSCSVIVRCDAHTTLPPDYVKNSVRILFQTGAANVGGRQDPVGTTAFERAVAVALTSRVGAGGARHRIGGRAGPVDTVYLGVYRREAFDSVGGYDGSLSRSQDSELNWRLRQNRELIWFDPSLVVRYRPRGSIQELASQYFQNGRWKSKIMLMHPKSAKARQLCPPILVLILVLSLLLAVVRGLEALLVPTLYGVILFAASAVVSIRRGCSPLTLTMIFLTMHLGWGLGCFFPARRIRS